ncbi:hypothetical protein [Paenarthrobacter sp. NPDC090522]|uniref:hypothetical protein n=1 Tax=Paenarthrobacter sp. NPDC090522 TaxID=3364383 RepID=UPI0038277349
MHSGNGEHQDMDAKAIACFDRALDDVGVSTGELRTVLHDYFAWATAHSMAAYPDSARDVPAGLRIPTWGWGGLLSR